MDKSDSEGDNVQQGQNGGDIVQAEAEQSSSSSSPPAEAEQSSPQANGSLIVVPTLSEIEILVDSLPTSPSISVTPSSPPTLPSDPQAQATQLTRHDLYKENRELSVELYTAALNGDWETLKHNLEPSVLQQQQQQQQKLDPRDILRANITKYNESVLHIAAGAGQTKFVEKLIKLMKLEKMELKDFKLPDKNGNTAFILAAIAGAKSIVEILKREIPELPEVRGNLDATPLYMAAAYGQADMVRCLHSIYEDIKKRDKKEFLKPNDREELFFTYIEIGLFNLALTLLVEDPRLAMIRNGEEETALHMLARKPSAFPIKSPGIWKTLINSCMMSIQKRKLNQPDDALKLVTCLWENILKDKDPADKDHKVRDDLEILEIIIKPWNLLFEAAKLGNFKFLAELVCLYPNFLWLADNENRTIFHIAVLHRHASIFNQIHNIGSIKAIIVEEEEDGSRNNILHLAAKIQCQSRLNEVSGAALQMQRELIWFQEVEKIVPPSYRERKNKDKLTPRELFTKSHEDLLKAGEKWMKGRAEFCLVVSTIITTVVFAAALTLPKRIDDSVKTPNLLAENWFQVFTMSVAISFSFSLFSIMIFLSLLTSRYTEKDFLMSLPYKLMAGLLTLFISMIAMMSAFAAAFVVAYDRKKRWAPILISATAFLPAAIFVWLQYSLFFDVFKSTLFSKSLFQPSKPMICKKSHRKS